MVSPTRSAKWHLDPLGRDVSSAIRNLKVDQLFHLSNRSRAVVTGASPVELVSSQSIHPGPVLNSASLGKDTSMEYLVHLGRGLMGLNRT